jgi:hypothetical protein
MHNNSLSFANNSKRITEIKNLAHNHNHKKNNEKDNVSS